MLRIGHGFVEFRKETPQTTLAFFLERHGVVVINISFNCWQDSYEAERKYLYLPSWIATRVRQSNIQKTSLLHKLGTKFSASCLCAGRR